MKKIIETPDAPAPIGPYSQAVLFDDTLYTSGQIAINPKSGTLVNEDIEVETAQVMKNIEAVLKAAGMRFSDVLKTTIYIKNMDHFQMINRIYGSFFDEATAPARETVEVARLPKDVNVEISVLARKIKGDSPVA
jgi:2-iminobutanoate/2-iminopropanoate deaminase